MKIITKRIYKTLLLLLILSYTISQSFASIIDNGISTTDTVSGLEWLDVTETQGMTYNTVISELGMGGAYAGWRYATSGELLTFINHYSGNQYAPNLTDTVLAPDTAGITNLLGKTFLDHTAGMLADRPDQFRVWYALIEGGVNNEQFSLNKSILASVQFSYPDIGSFLVKPVPVPAAIWLMGSGLVSLIGFSRKKKFKLL